MHTPTYENMEDTELKFGEVQLRWEQKPLPMHNLHMNMDIEISPLRGESTTSISCRAKASDPLMLVRGSF